MEFTREDYLEYCAMLEWDPKDPDSRRAWEKHVELAHTIQDDEEPDWDWLAEVALGR